LRSRSTGGNRGMHASPLSAGAPEQAVDEAIARIKQIPSE
jgi:hypothetical protein